MTSADSNFNFLCGCPHEALSSAPSSTCVHLSLNSPSVWTSLVDSLFCRSFSPHCKSTPHCFLACDCLRCNNHFNKAVFLFLLQVMILDILSFQNLLYI